MFVLKQAVSHFFFLACDPENSIKPSYISAITVGEKTGILIFVTGMRLIIQCLFCIVHQNHLVLFVLKFTCLSLTLRQTESAFVSIFLKIRMCFNIHHFSGDLCTTQ